MAFHRIVSVAVLLAAVGVAPSVLAQSTTTTTTTIERRTTPLKLTPQQRTVIYRTVTRDSRVAPPANVEIRAGAVIPPAVALSPFPNSVYVEVPALEQYKYFYVNNQLVLVDPRTSEVVDIIEQ